MKIRSVKNILVGIVAVVLIGSGLLAASVHAEGEIGFTMSPMKQNIVLSPGEKYQSSVSVSHANNNNEEFKYRVEVLPFTVNEDYQTVFEEHESGYSQIVDWITLDSPDTGTLEPNETDEIHFTIDVPRDAPGGGQYASIRVSSSSDSDGDGMNVKEVIAIGHLIFAEITGDNIRQAEFESIAVPGFLFDSDIKGTSAVKNTGNTHGEAKYTLQVYPLFSNEEIYTNEEDPETHLIIPDRTFYSETVWDKTPGMGIFNVVYTVEYEGVTKQVSKMVIKCPIWLLFIIFAIIAGIIIWIIARIRSRKKSKRASE